MSRETDWWLNNNTLIGFSDKRGTAWHYRKELQGGEPNHYPDAIPMDDVLRRLFNFTVEERTMYIEVAPTDGESDRAFAAVPNRKAMVCSDNDDVLGVFKSGYRGHQYQEWLIDNIAILIDSSANELGIGSAGLLRNRGQAWVSIEVPDSVTTPEGVEFRPNLLGVTSFDGSLATTFKKVVTEVVCDNTKDAALGEVGQQIKIKHSRYSDLRIHDAREALAIVFTIADDFSAEVKRLCKWEITPAQFEKLLHTIVPIDEDTAKAGITRANSKREQIQMLYVRDPRAATWTGTAYGALAAFNTYAHHYTTVKNNVPRIIRNMENVVTDKFADHDKFILDQLAAITNKELVTV